LARLKLEIVPLVPTLGIVESASRFTEASDAGNGINARQDKEKYPALSGKSSRTSPVDGG
jgi:hypothetical protein